MPIFTCIIGFLITACFSILKSVSQNKTLVRVYFIKAGITHIRDISYEAIPGLLNVSCIVKLINEYDSAIKVKQDYATLLSVIPEEWQKYCLKCCSCERSIASKFFDLCRK